MNISLQKNTPKLESSPVYLKRSSGSSVEIVLLLLFIILFYLFLVQPKNAQLAQKQQERQVLLDEESRVSGKIQTLKKLLQEMKSHKNQVVLLDEALPLDSRQTKLEILLSNLAGSAGVSVGDISVNSRVEQIYATDPEILKNPFKSARTLKKFAGNISVYGNMDQLVEFLKKLENSGRLIDINTFTLNPSDNEQLELEMTISSYAYTP